MKHLDITFVSRKKMKNSFLISLKSNNNLFCEKTLTNKVNFSFTAYHIIFFIIFYFHNKKGKIKTIFKKTINFRLGLNEKW